MQIKNYTPHVINLLVNGERVALEPEGSAPRLTTHEELLERKDGIDFVKVVYGDIDSLPEPKPDTLLIVPKMCCDAAPHRKDLCYPTRLVRDEEGRIVGCDALAQL